jgi:PAS domain S-box-containing protein
MKLRSKLILSGIALVLIPITFVSLFSIYKATVSLDSSARSKFSSVAKSLADMTQVALSEKLKMLNGLAGRPGISQLATTVAQNGASSSIEEISQLTRKLANFWELSGTDCESIIITSMDGIVYADAVHDTSNHICISDRDYFKTAVKGTVNIGTVVKSKMTGQPIVPLCSPIFSSAGEVVGTLTFLLSADFFGHIIANTKLGNAGYAGLADQNGIIIAHPSPELILKADMKAMRGMEEITRKALKHETGSETYFFSGVEKIGGYAPVKMTGWTVIASGPVEEQLAAVYQLRRTLILFGISFFSAALVLILVAARRLTRPISRLATAAQRYGDGDMGYRTGLQHTHDELGKLATSFDDMASLLEKRASEQRRAENALKESEAKYRDLIETTDTGYVIVDEEGRVLDANAEYIRLSGYTTIDEILGRSVLEWTASHDADGNGAEIRKCIATGKVRNLEIDYVDGQGRITPVEINGTLTHNTNGQVIICLVKDIKERKRLEAELHEAYEGLEVKIAERTAELAAMNEYLENILENSPDGIGIVDEHGNFIRWNTAAAGQFGYSFEELRGKSAFELYADNVQLGRMLTDLRNDGFVKSYAVDLIKRHGEIAPFEFSISLLRSNSGKVIGSVTVARDLTPLKKVNEELQKEVERRISIEASLIESEAIHRDSERKYRILYQEFCALLDAIPDSLVLFTPDFKVVWANRAYAARAGKEKEPSSIIGEVCYKELYGRETPCNGCPAPASFNSGEPATSIVSTKRGRVLEVRSVPVKDENRAVIKLINVTRDITETRKAEEELQRTYMEMAQVLASIPSFLIGLTADNKIMRWNGAAEKTFGIQGNNVIGKPFHLCGIHWDWEKVCEAILICQNGDKATKLDNFRFAKTDGKEGFLGVTFSPLEGRGNNSAGVLLLGADITERRILESQLVQAQKLESIGQLAAGIAHEINTPAQYVGDNARFLLEVSRDLERISELYGHLLDHLKSKRLLKGLVQQIEEAAAEIDLEYIRQEAPKAVLQSIDGIERISRIVRAMKEFSHPGTDSKTNIDLNKAIESTITVARNEWKYVAETVTDLDPNLPLVPCLPAEINQVILNMIINAAHAIADSLKKNGSDGKGSITITSRAVDNWAEVSISDTGTGISEDIRSKIFDPFFTTKGVGKGTGQGLAISRSVVVDKHGGTITFDSEVGRGTTFFIRLPLRSDSKGLETGTDGLLVQADEDLSPSLPHRNNSEGL